VLSAAGVVTHFVGWLLDLSEREAAQRGEREATALLVQVMESDHRRDRGGRRRSQDHLSEPQCTLRLAPGRDMIGETFERHRRPLGH